MREVTFPAMGTTAHVAVVGGGRHVLDRARSRIEDLERRWSRFLPTSEISVLNRTGVVVASPDTRMLVATAVDAWRRTGGRFDPTVHQAMVRNGYDAPYAGDGDRGEPRREPTPGCDGITLDAGSVRLPEGVGFDPGGIGKGLAADIVAEELAEEGASGVLVNLGGDVRTVGTGPDGDWTIAVDEPLAGTRLTVHFTEGAVATSTPLRRRWTAGGHSMHHLVDPASGLPVAGAAPVLVSVVAADGWWAEACTKVGMLLPSAGCGPLLEEAAAVIVHADGRRDLVNGMERYLG